MKRYYLLITVIVASVLSGCIISKTPETNDVKMNPGESINFSVTVFPSNATFSWTLDEVPLSNTGNSYVYTAEAGFHILVVTEKHLLGTDTQTWNIICSPGSLEEDLALLNSMKQEILDYIGDAGCSSVEGCRYIAFGKKPCGGPWTYLIYCTETLDEEHLYNLVKSYNGFNNYINKTYGLASDCEYVGPPKGLALEVGRCIAVPWY